MKKRTYGSGSFRKLASGSYELRYKGESKTIDVASDKQADRALGKWVLEKDAKAARGPEISMNDLLDGYLLDHRKKKRVETAIVEQKIDKYLRPRIGELDARKFGKDELDAYLDTRTKDIDEKTGRQPENATLNREISIISRTLRIAAEKLQRIVIFEKLQENPPRQGIVIESTYQEFLLELPNHVKPLWCFAYYTGVRSGELKKLRWEWVDLEEWVVRVPGYYGKDRITKNGQVHVIPVYLEMREFVKMMYSTRNQECPFLFQRDGQRIKSFSSAFNAARAKVRLRVLLPKQLHGKINAIKNAPLVAFNSVPDQEAKAMFERALAEKLTARQIHGSIRDRETKPGRVLFHDQRRTAVTNMIKEGIPEHEAMSVSGHLDPSMLKRYSITKERDVQHVGVRMTERFRRKREEQKNGNSAELWDKLWGDAHGQPSNDAKHAAPKRKQ